MIHRPLALFLLVALLAMGSMMAFAAPLQAYAAPATIPEGSPSVAQPKTIDEKGQSILCKDVPEASGGALLGVIVPCLTYTIEKSTMRFTAAMVSSLEPVFQAFLLLVVLLFGVRLAQNEPNIHKQGFLLLIKIALVATLLADLGSIRSFSGAGSSSELIPAVYSVMNEGQAILLGAIDSTSLHCKVSEFGGPQTPPVWATLDCVAGKMFGFKMSDGASKLPVMFLGTSMFGLLSGFLFGGAWGVVVFFGMLGVLISMFTLIVRVVLTFLIGYLTACLMLILMPLFVPLTFMNVTKAYFEGVWKNLLSAFLMPLLITGYAMLALMIYDKMLFAPGSMVQVLFDYERIKNAMQLSKNICDRQVTGNPGDARGRPTPAEMDNLLKNNSPFLQQLVMPALSGGNNLCGGLKKPVLNLNDIDHPDFKKGRDTYQKLFEELLQLFVVAYLLHMGLGRVTGMIQMLTAAGSGLTALQAASKVDFNFEQAGHRIRETMMDQTKGKDGYEFVTRVAPAAREGIKEFFTVLTGNKK